MNHHIHEQILVGRMMLAGQAADVIATLLRAEDYADTRNSAIHAAVTGLRDAGRPSDSTAVLKHLAAAGKLRHVDNGAYLITCIEAAGAAGDDAYHARIVVAAASARQAKATFTRAIDRLADTDDAAAIIQAAVDELSAIGAPTDPEAEILWADAVAGLLDEVEKAPDKPTDDRVPTGHTDLDRILGGGFAPGEVIVVAGRPGMGKSVMAMNLAASASFHRKIPTLVYSLEMDTNDLVHRMAASTAKVPLTVINKGNLTDDDWLRMGRFVGDYEEAPLWIDDRSTVDLAHLRARCRHHARVNGLGLVVIDYLQLLEVGRAENRQVAIASLTRGLKNLARELRVPIVLVAQLNREVAGRADKRPQLTDLRESGAVEQDADIVILLHRDDYYDKDSPRAGEADFIVAKNRRGPQDTVTVAAQLHFARFVDMAIG